MNPSDKRIVLGAVLSSIGVSATVVLMLLSVLLTACAGGGPIILSGYRDMYNPAGSRRAGAHPAIDFGGAIGDPVLAAADGHVVAVYVDGPKNPCGNGVKLWHADFNRFTLYCQLSEVKVRLYDHVARGQVIALLGNTGEPSWFPRAIPMLHFGLFDSARRHDDGDLLGTFDPMAFMAGCFDPAKTYPKDRLVLTFPVQCRDEKLK